VSLRNVIGWLGLALILYGMFCGIEYMFECPKLSQFYLVDIEYWKRTIPVPIGIVIVILSESKKKDNDF
jgi:hypothetical protein